MTKNEIFPLVFGRGKKLQCQKAICKL